MTAIEYGTKLAYYTLLYGLLGVVFGDAVRAVAARGSRRRR